MHKKDKILTSEQLETWIRCVTFVDAPKNCYECSMFVVAEVDGCDQVAFDHIRATMDSLTAAETRIEAVLKYQSSIDWGNATHNANHLAAILRGECDE
jgi:hypothetical protein